MAPIILYLVSIVESILAVEETFEKGTIMALVVFSFFQLLGLRFKFYKGSAFPYRRNIIPVTKHLIWDQTYTTHKV